MSNEAQPYKTKIDWKVSLVFRDPKMTERIAGKSPVIHIFDRDKHPIRFTQ